MKFFCFVTLLLIVPISCRTTEQNSEAKKFYENSRRRPTELNERQAIARLGHVGCAAFFVESPAKNLLISATHCAPGGNFAKWCTDGGYVTDAFGVKNSCVKLIASDVYHDIVLFEVKSPLLVAGYKLAAFSPAQFTYLRVIGFPTDKNADQSTSNVTENCWIVSETEPDTRKRIGLDEAAWHNCSIYGGNSGGPILAEGTDIVVGLPNEFIEGDPGTINRDWNSEGSFMVKMSDFVRTFRKTLETYQVTVTDQLPKVLTDDRKYLLAAAYTSPTLPQCHFVIMPKYFSGPDVRAMSVFYQSLSSHSPCHNNVDNYTCDVVSANFVCRSGKAAITNIEPSGFTYLSPGGLLHKFYLH